MTAPFSVHCRIVALFDANARIDILFTTLLKLYLFKPHDFFLQTFHDLLFNILVSSPFPSLVLRPPPVLWLTHSRLHSLTHMEQSIVDETPVQARDGCKNTNLVSNGCDSGCQGPNVPLNAPKTLAPRTKNVNLAFGDSISLPTASSRRSVPPSLLHSR